MLSLIRKALLIGTFIVLAYVGASLFNHHKMKGEIDTLRERMKMAVDVDVEHLAERLNMAPFPV